MYRSDPCAARNAIFNKVTVTFDEMTTCMMHSFSSGNSNVFKFLIVRRRPLKQYVYRTVDRKLIQESFIKSTRTIQNIPIRM